MRTSIARNHRLLRGFTLIELLVVIAIIAILAGLLLPAIAKAKLAAQKGKARDEIKNIEAAIGQYETAYSRLPVSSLAAGAVTAANPDFTFGTSQSGMVGGVLAAKPGAAAMPMIKNIYESAYQANNSDVIAILMDVTNVPGVAAAYQPNPNHTKNPQQTPFLNVKMTGDTLSSGVGTDLVYRDPWGNPYIITLDLNYDNKTRDGFYCQSIVSNTNTPGNANPTGLTQTDPANANSFEASTTVMVWSLGPDGQASTDGSGMAQAGILAGTPPNKDNILGWQ